MTTIGARVARVDLDVYGGQPVDVEIPVLDAAGVALPVAGWTGTAQVRAAPGGQLLHTLTLVLAGTTARVTATGSVTRAWCASWPTASATWDLHLIDQGGLPHVLCAGWVRLTHPITTGV
ncbi:MAG: hypothetical protein ACRCZP_12360 [Phycicoccus sp.]